MAPSQTFLRGAVTTTDRVTNVHRESWRQNIHTQVPIGRAPLTGFMMAMGSKELKSRHHNWPVEPFDAQRGDVLDVYTDSALSSAYASGGVVGTTLYISMTANEARQIIVGDILLIIDDLLDVNVHIIAGVEGVNVGSDTSSFVAVSLQQADTGSNLASTSLTWRIAGNAQAESNELPIARFADPEWYLNQTQIQMDSIEFSGTELAEEENLSPDKRARGKKQSLQRMMVKMERSNIFGRYKTTTRNSKPLRYQMGVKQFIEEKASANILNYLSDSNYAGRSWLEGGMEFLEDVAQQTSIYTEHSVKQVFCGGLAHQAINRLVMDQGHYNIRERVNAFGIKVTRLIGLNQDWDIIQHPLFNADTQPRRAALLAEMPHIRKCHLRGRDLQFVPASKLATDGFTWVDGEKEGYFVEHCIEVDNLDVFGWLDNLGLDNTA